MLLFYNWGVKVTIESVFVYLFFPFINAFAGNLDRERQTDVVVLDYVKPVDSVLHSLQFSKWESYSIDHLSIQLIKNWFTDRKRTVILKGSQSNPAHVSASWNGVGPAFVSSIHQWHHSEYPIGDLAICRWLCGISRDQYRQRLPHTP